MKKLKCCEYDSDGLINTWSSKKFERGGKFTKPKILNYKITVWTKDWRLFLVRLRLGKKSLNNICFNIIRWNNFEEASLFRGMESQSARNKYSTYFEDDDHCFGWEGVFFFVGVPSRLEVEKPSDSFIGETGSFGPVETAGARKKVENLVDHLKTSTIQITHMEGHSLANRTQPCPGFQL